MYYPGIFADIEKELMLEFPYITKIELEPTSAIHWDMFKLSIHIVPTQSNSNHVLTIVRAKEYLQVPHFSYLIKDISRQIEKAVTYMLHDEYIEHVKQFHKKVQENKQKYNTLDYHQLLEGYNCNWNESQPQKVKAQIPETITWGADAELRRALPNLETIIKDCPAPCSTYGDVPLSMMIIHLNDAENWTREQIADWLESLDINLEFKEAG